MLRWIGWIGGNMPELVVGSPPRGEDYFGREDLVERLWTRLKNDNVLLAAPRRFGKTGLMYRLLDDPRPPFRPIYIDVEDITSAADFMVELLAALLRDRHFGRILRELRTGAKDLGRFLGNLPASIDVGGLKIELREQTAVAENWLSYGERVMNLLAQDGPPLLLLIDEFAIMASSIESRSREEVAQFLRWFRAARIDPETQTRFVIGSSINLISTLDSMGLVDTVNDLWVENLKPFPRPTAERFVESIFRSQEEPLSPEVRDVILDQVGTPIPYLLAVLLTAIFDRQRINDGPVTVEMVHAAFEDDLLGGATAAVFHHYRSRLDEYYTDAETRAAKSILGALSRAGGPMQRSTLYQLFLKTNNLEPSDERSEEFLQLMTKLENDFYVRIGEDGFDFYSRVLKLWWKARYGFQGLGPQGG
jgi:hypothetical protein